MRWPNIFIYLMSIPAIFLTVTVHEYSKAFVSFKLGDNIPKTDGRLTLNPFKHFEPIGFIFMLAQNGIGWGKPVRMSSMYYKDRKKGTVIVNVVPIVANIILSFIALFISYLLGASKLPQNTVLEFIGIFLYRLSYISLTLAIFNIIPVAPLCGSRILYVFLQPNTAIKISQNEKIFQILLMLFIFMGFIQMFIFPVVDGVFFLFDKINMFILNLIF